MLLYEWALVVLIACECIACKTNSHLLCAKSEIVMPLQNFCTAAKIGQAIFSKGIPFPLFFKETVDVNSSDIPVKKLHTSDSRRYLVKPPETEFKEFERWLEFRPPLKWLV